MHIRNNRTSLQLMRDSRQFPHKLQHFSLVLYNGFTLVIYRQAKDVIKQIKKRLGSKTSNTQLLAVMLLEMLMNNIGEHIHKQVIDVGLLPMLVKIVKKKSDFPIQERIFLLLDATQTSLGGASGKFPQYHTAYHELVSAGVKFAQRAETVTSNRSISKENNNNSLHASTKSNNSDVAEQAILKHERGAPGATPKIVPESSIIQKASHALEILREVLDAANNQNPEGAKDEFTLDLVEQCSFQKQRVMQLVLTSKDEKVVSRAIDLNEELQRVLARHDALLSGRSTLNENNCNHEETEDEEEVQQLFRRIRKGKACAVPENEGHSTKLPIGWPDSTSPKDRLHRPLIRPLTLEPSHDSRAQPPAVIIPPPPAKHMEREKFFQENKADGSTVAGHMRGLSLHSRNASSSHSDSLDSSD